MTRQYIQPIVVCAALLALSMSLLAQDKLIVGPEPPIFDRVQLEIGARYTGLISGSIQGQESPSPDPNAPSYDLNDLGVNHGYALFANLKLALTKDDAISASFSYNRLSGETNLPKPIVFDDVLIPAGSATTTVHGGITDLLYHRHFSFPKSSAWNLELNGGVRQFLFATEVKAPSGTGDQEDLIAPLVPTFGAILSYRPSTRWEFALDVSGSAPGDVVAITDESVDVAYWTAGLVAAYRLGRNIEVRGGVYLSGLNLDFEGTETDQDHGHNSLEILAIQPAISVSVRF
jgi:hypothetical protein